MFKSIINGIKAEMELKNLLMEEDMIKEEHHIEKRRETFEKLYKYRDYTQDLIRRIKNKELKDVVEINKEIEKMNRLNVKLSGYRSNILTCFDKGFYTFMYSTNAAAKNQICKDREVIIEIITFIEQALFKLNDLKRPIDEIYLFNDDDYNL